MNLANLKRNTLLKSIKVDQSKEKSDERVNECVDTYEEFDFIKCG